MASTKTKKIGKYEILDILGKGGMGVVYKAVDPSIGRLVAIKMITGNYADDAAFLKRFYREAQSTGKLQHPNIVIVYELGDFDGNPFLVMEFLEGESLDVYIREKRPLPLLEKLNLMVQVCNGLQYAHERNVIHRDIKPANLMVAKGGVVKIVDFGIARIIEADSNVTMPSQVIGTIQYMSPEQINGKHVDGRTDVFSTAVVLYQFLTLHLPFDGTDTGSTLLKIINDPPPPLSTYLNDYPPELDAILQRALAKTMDERYPSAEEFAFDLMQAQEQLRREAAAEYRRIAEDAMQRGEFGKAREQCLEILRLDRQDTGAKRLLQEIQQRIKKQQRDEQARQLRRQAEEAVAVEELDRALLYLSQAADLDPQNTELLAFQDSVRESKLRADQHHEAFRRAQSAHLAGDLTEALEAIEQALALDSSDTDAQALRAEVAHEIEQRKRQAQIQGLVEEAQHQIASRQFTAALEALAKAEALDPTAPGVRELMSLASAGREQEIRRKELERASAGIADALNQDDYVLAAQRCDDALKQFPGDRGLLKLKAMAERRREAAEKRQFIEEQVSGARKLLDNKQTEDALRNLEAALTRYPNEPALMSVLTIVKQTLQQERDEARKNDYIRSAKEALRLKHFEEAIQVLETGCAELPVPELEDLLQYAHEEAAAFEHQQIIEAAANEARRLMSAEEYEQAISFLTAILADVVDEELQIILADAERQVEDFNRRVNECVETTERLLRVDRVTEAVRFLDSQPPALNRSPRFREISERARDCQERLRQIAAAVEKARTALSAREWNQALESIEECRRDYGDHPELARAASQITADREEAATSAVTKATNDSRMLLLGRSYEAAMQLLDAVAGMVEFAPEALRLRYTALHDEAERGLLRKQQEDERAREISELKTADDTKERTSWALHAASRQPTDAQALRRRDVEELQQLAQDAQATSVLEELSAISARARVLAGRHGDDAQIRTAASEVVTTATMRANSLTGISPAREPGAALPSEESAAAEPEPVKAGRPSEAPTFFEPPAAPVEGAGFPPSVTMVPGELGVEGEAAVPAQASALQVPAEMDISPPALLSQETQVAEPEPAAASAAERAASPPAGVEAAPQPKPDLEVVAPPAAEVPVEQVPPTMVVPPPEPPQESPVELPAWRERVAAGAEELRAVAPQVPIPESPPPTPLRTGKRVGPVPASPRDQARPPGPSNPGAEASGVLVGRPAPVLVPPRPRAPFKPRLIAVAVAAIAIAALLIWKFWPSSAPARGSRVAAGKPLLVVSSTPAGAQIQVQDETCVTPKCRLRLSPGDYEIKASLAGYKSESRIVHVVADSAPPAVAMALQPLPTVIRINTNLGSGDVTLDGKSVGALRQGQLELPNVPAGQHTLKVSGTNEHAELMFDVGAARAPEVGGRVTAQGASALVVSSLAGHVHVSCNCDEGAQVVVDGHDAGQAMSGRRDLGNLSEGSHQLQIGGAANAVTHLVRLTGAPALDVFLDAQRNVGILVVQAGVPDAVVYVDGRKSGTTGTDGVYRTALPAKTVAVRVAKTGYKAVPQQMAELRKSGETGLTFELKPIADKAKLVVAGGQPDTSVSVDGQAIGRLSKGGRFSAEVAPGNHTVEFSREGFEAKKINLSFTPGDTKRLTPDLRPLPPPKVQASAPPQPPATPATSPPPAQPPVVKIQPAPSASNPEQEDWRRARDSRDPAVLEAFLGRYPGGPSANEARERLRQLQLSADRNDVLATLKRYADAYQHKSTDELEAIWPTLGKPARKKISDSFKSAQSIHVDLKPSGDPAVSGDIATVTCDRNLLFTFPGGEQRTFSDRVTIRLRKKAGTWIIDSVS